MSDQDKIRFEELRKMYNGKDLADCFANLHMTFDREVSVIKSEIAKTNNRVDVLESNAELVNDNLQNIHNNIVPNLEEKINEEANERVRLELWGRKWNLVIGGINGTLNETPRITESRVRAFFVTSLGMPKEEAKSILLQAVHRLPGGDDNKRRIIVRFNSLMVRDEILSRAIRTLKRGCGFSVVPDVPPSVATLRYKLLMKRREMPVEEQKKTKLVYLKSFPFVALRKTDR